MFKQFFGNFLLNEGAVSTEQLISAISDLSKSRIKLGTLAISSGLMTAAEVDECCMLQSTQDKRFGEIAIDRGYLTQAQVNELLSSQQSDYLLLGQTLVDNGAITNSDLENYLIKYQSVSEFEDSDFSYETQEKIDELIERFFMISELPYHDYVKMYLALIFNNLVRFIGDDFAPLTPITVNEYPLNQCTAQRVHGKTIDFTTHIDTSVDTAIQFASRYAKEEFTEYDEYVQASLDDFLNLHNGLYVVNISNKYSIEMKLEPPVKCNDDILIAEACCIVIPIVYSFGTLHLLVTL